MIAVVDTQALLWFAQKDPKLSETAKTFLEDPENSLFLSAATVWELAIKVSIGKLTLAKPYKAFISRAISENNFKLVPVAVSYCEVVATLPFHHKDPFDRLIIAQAKLKKAAIVSNDAMFDAYGITRIW